MELKDFLEKMDTGEEIEAGSEYHLFMHGLSQEALRITMEMNNAYHTPEELVELMRKLTGSRICPHLYFFHRSTRTAGRTSTSVIMCSSIQAADSKIRGAFGSGITR